MRITASKIAAILATSFLSSCSLFDYSKKPTTETEKTKPHKLALTPKSDDQIRIHYLPVGGGMCHVVECPGVNAKPMLLDCGAFDRTKGEHDLTKQQTIDTVHSILNGREPIVVISHSDGDHNNYIPAIFPDPTKVVSVWMGSKFNKYHDDIKNWVNAAEKTDVPVHKDFKANYSNEGEPVSDLACGIADTYILTVNAGDSANAGSMMLSIDHGDTHTIFPGDATGIAQDSAMKNFPGDLLRSTIVEASHHGSESSKSNSIAWAEATKPDYLITSAGTQYYHPRCNAVAVYQKHLKKAPAHDFICGNEKDWAPKESATTAKYNTEESSTIVVTADDKQNVDITCDGKKCSY